MITNEDIAQARAVIAAGKQFEFVTYQWPVKREVHGCQIDTRQPACQTSPHRTVSTPKPENAPAG